MSDENPIPSLGDLQDLYAKVVKYAYDGDDEAAHEYEDSLRAKTLEYIMATAEDDKLISICKLALSTKEFNFARWYA